MKVCVSCFNDLEIKSFISSSTDIGDCDTCLSKGQHQIDVVELFDFLQGVIDNFKTNLTGDTFINKLQSNWNLFASNDVGSKILDFAIPSLVTSIISSTTNVDYTDDIIDNYNHWNTLKEDLKWKNRFVIDVEYLQDLGWDGFFNAQFELTKGLELFRGRLHHESGLPANLPTEMGCPENLKTKAGRANPPGIPVLYLSDNPDTVLYEIRASFLDELSIGTFYLKPTSAVIKLVDFTATTSLFQPSPNEIKTIIKGKLLRDLISNDLSKPMRRYDNELDYLPTQFICEFIRIFTGASGIKFKSSVHPSGNNVVLFDQNLMECVYVKKVKISEVVLQNSPI